MTTLTRRFFLTAATGLTAAAAVPAFAGKNDNGLLFQPTFNPADKARIAKATAYLQALGTGQGRFQQVDFRGRTTNGNWYLQRPGKIRFEYDAPYSLLIVSDGRNVNMWDPRLQSFDQYPLDETPLSLFLSKQISFNQGVIIAAVSSNAAGFTLKARDRRKSVGGFVTMNFAQDAAGNVMLKEWTVVDQQNRPTTVKLVSFTRDSRLKPELFVLNKPQKK